MICLIARRSRRASLRGLAVALYAAALATPVAVGAAAPTLSLPEAVRLAGERAPILDAGRARVDSARESAAAAGALPDPMLTVGIDNLPVTDSDAFDTTADEMTMKKVGLRQEIPSGAKRSARRTLADREVDLALAEAEADTLNVKRAAAAAWIGVWQAERTVASLQALREQAALAARLAKARVSGGGGSVADALAAQSALVDVDFRIEAALAEREVARAELMRWLGDAPYEIAPAGADFDTLPFSEAELLAAVDRTASLRPAAAQVEAAAAAVDLARTDRRSDWSVAASYGQRSGGHSDMLMVEVGIGLPLFTRNRQDRDVASREADYEAALATREDRRRQEAARIRAAFARWEGLKRQVALHETSLLPLAEDRSSVAMAAYRAGGDLEPWLLSRREEHDVHLAHAEHVGDLGRAWAALAFLLPPEERP